MRDNQDVLATLELHDDGLKTDDDVPVALTAKIAIVVFVCVSRLEVGGILLLDLGICETIADAAVELVKCFPR